MKLFHTFIQQAAYEVLVENRREALRRSGSMILHGDEGRMTAEEIAEAINKNPDYGQTSVLRGSDHFTQSR